MLAKAAIRSSGQDATSGATRQRLRERARRLAPLICAGVGVGCVLLALWLQLGSGSYDLAHWEIRRAQGSLASTYEARLSRSPGLLRGENAAVYFSLEQERRLYEDEAERVLSESAREWYLRHPGVKPRLVPEAMRQDDPALADALLADLKLLLARAQTEPRKPPVTVKAVEHAFGTPWWPLHIWSYYSAYPDYCTDRVGMQLTGGFFWYCGGALIGLYVWMRWRRRLGSASGRGFEVALANGSAPSVAG